MEDKVNPEAEEAPDFELLDDDAPEDAVPDDEDVPEGPRNDEVPPDPEEVK